MSDTPRTDAAAVSREYIEREMVRQSGAARRISDLARMGELERELAEIKEQLRLCNVDQFTTAAELAEAVAKERERCAKVCEEFYSVENIAQKCAAAIRKGE
jgi:hypothetical protein